MLLPQPRVYLTGMKKKLQQEEKAKIWHKGMGLVFQDYNELLEKGMLVRCSDGNVRDIRMIFGLMIGDQPELETACCCVGVRILNYLYISIIHIYSVYYIYLFTSFEDENCNQ